MTATAIGGWATRQGEAHWWRVDGRPACSPGRSAVPEEDPPSPYSAPGGCRECAEIVARLRAEAALLGWQLQPTYRYPATAVRG